MHFHFVQTGFIESRTYIFVSYRIVLKNTYIFAQWKIMFITSKSTSINGTTGAGGKEKNNIKSLSSKSGNIIKLDDNKGSVYISDKGTANIRFDGAGNATTNANVNHNINAGKNNTINAGQTHAVHVGATKEQPPQASFFINEEGNIVLDAKTKIILKVGGNNITISKDGIVTSVEEGEIKSTASAGPVTLISTAAEATFGGSTNTNVGGGAITLIVGGEVEVNQS